MNSTEQTALDAELLAVAANWGPHLQHIQVKNGNIVGIQRLMYTWALLSDVTAIGYGRRWCYKEHAAALAALDAWDGADDTEPDGWHRAVDGTGRRRPDGDPAREYVEF